MCLIKWEPFFFLAVMRNDAYAKDSESEESEEEGMDVSDVSIWVSWNQIIKTGLHIKINLSVCIPLSYYQ